MARRRQARPAQGREALRAGGVDLRQGALSLLHAPHDRPRARAQESQARVRAQEVLAGVGRVPRGAREARERELRRPALQHAVELHLDRARDVLARAEALGEHAPALGPGLL